MHNKKKSFSPFPDNRESYDANPIILLFLYRISAVMSKIWTVIIGP